MESHPTEYSHLKMKKGAAMQFLPGVLESWSRRVGEAC